MLSFHYSSVLSSQINELLNELSPNNIDLIRNSLHSLYIFYSDDCRLFVLKSLISLLEFHNSSSKDLSLIELLQSEIQYFTVSRPNHYSILLCRAIEASLSASEESFTRFSRSIKLNLPVMLSVSILLCQSVDSNIREFGLHYLKLALNQLQIQSNTGATALQLQINDTLIHDLLFFVQTNSSLDSTMKTRLVQNLTLLAPKTCDQLTIQPLLTNTLHSIDSINVRTNNIDFKQDLTSRALIIAAKPSRVLQDLGYSAMESNESLKEAFQLLPVLTTTQIAGIICMMCRTYSNLQVDDTYSSAIVQAMLIDSEERKSNKQQQHGSNNGWNATVFVNVLKELYPSLSWKEVFENLDQPEFSVDSQSLNLLLEIHNLATNNSPFPVQLFLREWNNSNGQLSFLQTAIPSKLDIFASHLNMINPITLGETSINPQFHCWYSLDLLETLLELGETNLYSEVKSLMKQAAEKCPQLLLTGLVTLKSQKLTVKNSSLKDELLSVLLPVYLGFTSNNNVNSKFIQQLYSSNPTLFQYWLSRWYLSDKSFINQISELATSLRDSLNNMLETRPFEFAIALANQASKQGEIKLEEWLQTKISEYSSEFVESCANFLIEQLGNGNTVESRVSLENLSVFFNVLIAHKSLLPTETINQLVNAYQHASAHNSQLLSIESKESNVNSAGSLEALDGEVTQYYQQFYSGLIPLETMLETFNRCKSSIDQREQAIYSGLIYVLFDEYKFFNNYPLPELKSSAVLFGSLIQHKLLPSVFLRGLALKYVLEALKQSADSKLFQFGMWCLETFRASLPQLTQFCQLILAIPNISLAQSQLVNYLNSLLQQQALVPGIISQSLEEQIIATSGLSLPNSNSPEIKSRSLFSQTNITIEPSSMIPVNIGGGSVGLFASHPNSLLNSIDPESDFNDNNSSASIESSIMNHFVPPSDSNISSSSYINNNFPQVNEPTTTHSGIFSGVGSFLGGNSSLDLSINNAVFRTATNGNDTAGNGNGNGNNGNNSNNSNNNNGSNSNSNQVNNNDVDDQSNGGNGSNSNNGSISSIIGDGSGSPSVPPGLGGGMKPPGLGLSTNNDSPSLTSSTPRRNPSSTTNANSQAGQSFGSSLNIDSLLSAERDGKPLPLAPSENTKDKIHFIINNVSKSNLRSKGRELKIVLKPEFYAYFARYLVIKRVSIEANFQKLYAQFLDAVGLNDLKKQMIETTYDNIKVLLQSDKVVSSSSERSLLKNLGSWLGLLTIAKNKPIRAKYLDLKQLILEAVDTGRLIAVIPFCAKILDSCVESKVFKPPNPWLMALIGLLREIFDLPGLKLNLKFEIEVLFNNLLISMKDVKPQKLLLAERSLSGDDSRKFLAQQPPATANNNQQNQPTQRIGTQGPKKEDEANELLNQQNLQVLSGTNAATTSSTGEAMINNLPTYVSISPVIALFNLYPHLKRCVPTSIDRAIREIISPVVERSVTIACVTTRELILKDFALEPDENKIRTAAHQMVTNLTSSLALVTCKEPLRVSINNHLGSLLEANTQQSERQLVEQACLQVSADNLELGCTLIEKAAAERAIREIDETLAPVYKQRATQRQAGQPFVDLSIFAGKFPSSLPEPLRAKPTGLSTNQLRVYDDFSRIRQHYSAAAAAAPATETTKTDVNKPVTTNNNAAAPTPAINNVNPVAVVNAANVSGTTVVNPLQQTITGPNTGLTSSTASNTSGAAASSLTSQQTLEKLVSYLANLEQAVLRFPNHKSIPLHSVTTAQQPTTNPTTGVANPSIGSDHEIQILLRMLASLLNGSARDESTVPKEMIALTFAQKVFKRLYDRENRTSLLQIDVHTQVLKCIRAVCPKVVTELTHWLLYGDDDRKFIMPITAALLRARLLSSPDVDLFLSKLCINVQNSGQAVTTAVNPQSQQQPNAPATVHVLHPHLEFVFALIKRVVIKRPILQVVELSNTLDALTKLAATARHKILADTIQHLLEDVRNAALQAERERENEVRQQQLLRANGGGGGITETNDPLTVAQAQQQAAAAVVAVQVATAQQIQQQQQQQQIPVVNPSLQLGSLVNIPGLENKPSHLIWDEDLDALDREIEEQEPAGLRQQVMYLLDDWMNICLQGTASDKTYGQYLAILHQQRVLSTSETTSRFFRIIIQLCVESALQSVGVVNNNNPNDSTVVGSVSYTAIDALAKLFVFLVKFLEPNLPANQTQNGAQVNPNASKIRLLNSFLTSAALVLRRDFEHNKTIFNQRPYLRLFNNLLHDLNTPDPMLDSNNIEVLAAFGHCFRYLRPSRVPAFTFAWLELISHRMFMSKLLISKSINCSILMARLLVDLLKFLQPYLRNAELTDSIRLVYKGTLRLLLVLLHDFPEFLCEFHFSFCDYIPTQAIQMRNLILSAFPRNMRLPDPFTPNLKVDLLPEISQSPRIAADCTAVLIRIGLKTDLDLYLQNRQPASFLKQLQQSLVINFNGALNTAEANHQIKRAGTQYNIPLINSIILYVGSAGINNLQNQSKTGQQSQFQDNSCMDIFESLIIGCDSECRYYLLNAIANQLRYPNNHTHYFSCVLLYLFLQCKDEVIMEQITRVLLERLIVHRPHPWGLLITFIELIKNPRYEFWRQPFTRQAPEIERLFESVARSCMPNTNNTGVNTSNTNNTGTLTVQQPKENNAPEPA